MLVTRLSGASGECEEAKREAEEERSNHLHTAGLMMGLNAILELDLAQA